MDLTSDSSAKIEDELSTDEWAMVVT
jgi:hypothetical protein